MHAFYIADGYGDYIIRHACCTCKMLLIVKIEGEYCRSALSFLG